MPPRNAPTDGEELKSFERFDRFIKGAIMGQFPDEKFDELEVQYDRAFKSDEVEGRIFFHVLNRTRNILYTVVAQEQPDGTLADYRAGIV